MLSGRWWLGGSGPAWGRRVALAAACLLLGACAPLRPAYDPGEPFMVALPLRQAGIADGRAAFAALFDAELKKASWPQPASHWLHAVSAMAPAAPAPAAATLARTSVLVIPGIFGDCVDGVALPFSDGVARPPPRNYLEGYGRYADLGLASLRAVRISGRASSAANGEVIAREIEAEAARAGSDALVVVAYSKGVPDTLHALESLRAAGRLPTRLRALVSVAGVVGGTPLADALHEAYDVFAGAQPLACPPSAGGEVTSLTRHERLRWLAQHPLPETVRGYSVVAHARTGDTAPGLRSFQRALSGLDARNDGQVIAAAAVLPGSTLLAEVDSDHWKFVLPLEEHPSALVRHMTRTGGFPREAFFRALLRAVAEPEEGEKKQ